MRLKTLLELGRVSNVPTVWSNVLCGAALSGAFSNLPAHAPALVFAGLAGTAFYVGGMFLNDAFDAEIDARERPERPIPRGEATREQVQAIGGGLLAAGIGTLVLGALLGLTPAGMAWPLAGAATALAVVFYDRFHKGIAWSPVVMGLCRAGLYVLGALAVAAVPSALTWQAAAALLLYIVGLTHIARFETATAVGRFWPAAFLFAPLALALFEARSRDLLDPIVLGIAAACVFWTLRALDFARRGGRSIGTAVVSLIAGISLVDALFAAAAGAREIAAIAFSLTALTLVAQRKVRGT
ncbi:MAG TPA: UbiA family prenyltransferase [Polyangiaceae bacterium]